MPLGRRVGPCTTRRTQRRAPHPGLSRRTLWWCPWMPIVERGGAARWSVRMIGKRRYRRRRWGRGGAADGRQRSRCERRWPLHERSKPREGLRRSTVDAIPFGRDFGRQDESVAIGENLAGGVSDMGDDERCEVRAARDRSPVDEIAFFGSGADLQSLGPCPGGRAHCVTSPIPAYGHRTAIVRVERPRTAQSGSSPLVPQGIPVADWIARLSSPEVRTTGQVPVVVAGAPQPRR